MQSSSGGGCQADRGVFDTWAAMEILAVVGVTFSDSDNASLAMQTTQKSGPLTVMALLFVAAPLQRIAVTTNVVAMLFRFGCPPGLFSNADSRHPVSHATGRTEKYNERPDTTANTYKWTSKSYTGLCR